MNNRERQELEERTIFDEFAKVCPLPLLAETTRMGPDPPDILCDLEPGETLGFELVSAEDVTRDLSVPEKIVSVTKKGMDAYKLERALREAYRESVVEGRIIDPNRFECHTVKVTFLDTATFKRRRRAVDRAIELLNQLGPGRHLVNEGPIRSITCRPWSQQSSWLGPLFSTGGAHVVGVEIVKPIMKKISASGNYNCIHSTHLLAWSSTVTAEELQMLGKDEELAEYLRSNGMGQFDRIWLFGRSEKCIAFDSSAWSLGSA